MTATLIERQQEWYYIVARHEGKMVLLGPFRTESEANEKGYGTLQVPFEVVKFPTKDRGRATQMLKARMLDKTGSLEESLEKVRHTTTEKRNATKVH